MCFSAGASFAAGTAITAVGVATLKEVKRPSHKLFASVPLIFGIQQLAEGCLWFSLQNQGYETIEMISTYIFLLAAVVLCPFLIPLSVMKMEQDNGRRKTMKLLLVVGLILSAYYAYNIFFFQVSPAIMNCHIYYNIHSIGSLAVPAFLGYLLVTIIPLLLSTEKYILRLGIFMFLSCLVTVFFYKENLTSVWCFFAAIISIMIYVIIRVSQEESLPVGYRLLHILSDHNPWKKRFQE